MIQGTWTGTGRGQFPTVTSLDYRETLNFTRRDEKTIAYEQRTQKRYDGQTDWLESHWENGFIRILESREALHELADKLIAAGVDTKGVEQFVHTGNWYVAFRDPDNIQLEYWLP